MYPGDLGPRKEPLREAHGLGLGGILPRTKSHLLPPVLSEPLNFRAVGEDDHGLGLTYLRDGQARPLPKDKPL